MAPTLTEEWSGQDVRLADVEAELARLRGAVSDDQSHSHQRTSVMTHIAWVPESWLGAAERTLEGLAERHPSRTVILVPEPESEASRIDAELSVRCFAAADRDVCGEVIELHLHGERALAPASIVLPLIVADLPVFVRWRGQPVFGEKQWSELIGVADRVIVDSSEWDELRFRELADSFELSAVTDIAWARVHEWRVALADRWPEIRDQEISISGPRAESTLLQGWLQARLGRTLQPVEPAREFVVRLDGEELQPPREESRSPSDLLSAELDRFSRDNIYEEAVLAVA
jgi:hypothetical protein